ncbi:MULTISPECIES: bifunctional phosphopantothenoylcysteine decarboxylase/phosphopantothenate--cysteine ligase CoaBC [unclassified Dysgonomonas]|jgi:phosphopantothenoylcysteine decarboxylase/phosphopantothenate--cysteine ligase|uniref:bifunctional phosphopantothenoylcysteine decarboxylase/phosphopantothenate--cysteine ligase CoaBC n=1 Tax=unclassified Dysgonomonas TaxID=2630389 RepID=UPI0025C47257|nr:MULTISPECIES: bifunctional phosphopantothenoylcysteine decarboxylase/phosphopantothenate--cysteine ligase CoaBC [unclassified Dysgonomonas]MDR2001983.1 bifunctional phosphopantothenoylcysteine decarboxylase/phosphopantothenate--cysteine ligase CoaBC [Prevotella sp.]HMM02808.1 bifunctional phosphopantothenoylcysteine decarboxylase/phosphopantothenate--cysteine ligase CoaBC [Dysgonomonas sp.]
MTLKDKHIVLGITGSIAAYKAASLARLLIKAGAEVQIVITPSGKEFITPVTLSALTGKPVVSEFFTANDGTWHSHVDLGQWADLMLIAPATASTLGKMANGVADNMLITTYMSMKAPVVIAPAMDLDMFAHPATTRNLEILRSYGNIIIEPASGELASHLTGKGRMEEPEKILATVEDFFTKQETLSKKKVLITAGPTYERIDPVRFIGNYSSGKMGFALAEECAGRGAEVTLIAGPVSLTINHPNITRIDVESAEEMYNASVKAFPAMDAAILCAAVADFRPEEQYAEKVKRSGDILNISLVPNKDIAASLGKMKKANQLLVGFALETNDEENNALKKIVKKNLDFIVLNSLNDAGAGFKYNTNKIAILTRNGERKDFGLKSKKDVASDIIDETFL